MKIVKRILLLANLIVVLLILCKFSGIYDQFSGENTLRIEKAEVDFGNKIFGNKISVRDKIRVRQKGNFTVDGNYLSLGNEDKDIEMTFLAELGYTMEDIVSSERVDSLDKDILLSRTLLVEVPLPDTLSFIKMEKIEKRNEWFWEGWHRDHVNFAARQKFYKKLRESAYLEFRSHHMSAENTNVYRESAITILNYVNNAYQIGNDKGFDLIIVSFKNEDEFSSSKVVVRCDDEGKCSYDNDLQIAPLN